MSPIEITSADTGAGLHRSKIFLRCWTLTERVGMIMLRNFLPSPQQPPSFVPHLLAFFSHFRTHYETEREVLLKTAVQILNNEHNNINHDRKACPSEHLGVVFFFSPPSLLCPSPSCAGHSQHNTINNALTEGTMRARAQNLFLWPKQIHWFVFYLQQKWRRRSSRQPSTSCWPAAAAALEREGGGARHTWHDK